MQLEGFKEAYFLRDKDFPKDKGSLKVKEDFNKAVFPKTKEDFNKAVFLKAKLVSLKAKAVSRKIKVISVSSKLLFE